MFEVNLKKNKGTESGGYYDGTGKGYYENDGISSLLYGKNGDGDSCSEAPYYEGNMLFESFTKAVGNLALQGK